MIDILKILMENKKENYHYIFEDGITEPKRTIRLANGRNKIIEKVKELNQNGDYTYFIMLDMDDVNSSGTFIDSIESCFQYNYDDWDVLSGNQKHYYYDTWALSFDPYIYSSFHCENADVVFKKMCLKFNNTLDYYKKNTPDTFIEVYSAFNGFAVYKWSIFKNCNYDTNIDVSLFPVNILQKQIKYTGVPLIQYFKGDCEHRYFHMTAIEKNGARIRISPLCLFNE
jgi:hypothetical protein